MLLVLLLAITGALVVDGDGRDDDKRDGLNQPDARADLLEMRGGVHHRGDPQPYRERTEGEGDRGEPLLRGPGDRGAGLTDDASPGAADVPRAGVAPVEADEQERLDDDGLEPIPEPGDLGNGATPAAGGQFAPRPAIGDLQGANEAGGAGCCVFGSATHYGASYNGQPLGCAGYGVYSSARPDVVAVGPARAADWPCGTRLRVCARELVRGIPEEGRLQQSDGMVRQSLPDMRCIVVTRQDSCPGCGPNDIDLSESGFAAVCGPGGGRCAVSIEAVE